MIYNSRFSCPRRSAGALKTLPSSANAQSKREACLSFVLPTHTCFGRGSLSSLPPRISIARAVHRPFSFLRPACGSATFVVSRAPLPTRQSKRDRDASHHSLRSGLRASKALSPSRASPRALSARSASSVGRCALLPRLSSRFCQPAGGARLTRFDITIRFIFFRSADAASLCPLSSLPDAGQLVFRALGMFTARPRLYRNPERPPDETQPTPIRFPQVNLCSFCDGKVAVLLGFTPIGQNRAC